RGEVDGSGAALPSRRSTTVGKDAFDVRAAAPALDLGFQPGGTAPALLRGPAVLVRVDELVAFVVRGPAEQDRQIVEPLLRRPLEDRSVDQTFAGGAELGCGYELRGSHAGLMDS